MAAAPLLWSSAGATMKNIFRIPGLLSTGITRKLCLKTFKTTQTAFQFSSALVLFHLNENSVNVAMLSSEIHTK